MATILLNVKVNQADLNNARKQVEQAFNFKTTEKATSANEEYAKSAKKATKATRDSAKAIKDYNKSVEKNSQSIITMIPQILKWQIAMTAVMKPLRLMQDAWEDLNKTLVETEKRIVELNRVTNNMANADALYKLAQQYGQTFENVSDITLNFARNGMDWAKALKATEAALLAINVAELDATQASEGMIAIMQQFGYEANELEGIVDKLNITADNAAVTTEKLLTALQRTGSSAKNAKLSLEETVGIITALSEATGRSGENLGTAVNSLIQFSTKASSLETFEKLGGNVAKTVEAYRAGGATVLDIWEELSKVIKDNADYAQGVLGSNFSTSDFESLNEELKESLGESFAETTEIYDTASTFRKNYFIALLNNLDQVQKTLDTMNGAQGYSQKENLQYLDTYEAKVNKLQAKWKDIANDEQGLLGVKKLFVDIGIVLLEVEDKTSILKAVFVGAGVAAIGAFGPALLKGITLIVTALRAATAAGITFQTVMGGIGLAASVITVVVSLISDYNKKQKEIEQQEKINRDLAISTWKAQENHASELATVLDAYKQLDTSAGNYYKVENKLVDLIGDKKKALEGLTKGTDEYRKALINMAEAELNAEEQKQSLALDAAKRNAENVKFEDVFYDSDIGTKIKDTTTGNILEEAGIKVSSKDKTRSIANNLWSSMFPTEKNQFTTRTYSLEGLKDVKTAEDAVHNLNVYKQTAEKIWDVYKKYLGEGNTEMAEKSFALYKNITSAIDEYKQDIEDYEWIQGNLDLIRELDKSLKDTDKTVENINKTIEQLTKEELDALISKFEELRDVNKEILDLEDARQKIVDAQSKAEEAKAKILEKQNELIKKQQALQDAYQQRTVRVFNASTGQWEQVANQKDIDKAKEDVAKAQLDVEQAQEDYLEAIKGIEEAGKDYERTAYNAMISLLQSGDVTTEEIKALVDTIAKYMPELAAAILQVLSSAGINLNGSSTTTPSKPINKNPSSANKPHWKYEGIDGFTPIQAVQKFDSGGVLYGMGGIKATNRPEIVLPPTIAEKILNPSSNEQFKNFTKSLGILFGASDTTSNFGRGNIIHNVGGNTNNTTNSNNSYVVNGVPFSQNMAETHTLAQLLEIAGQLS